MNFFVVADGKETVQVPSAGQMYSKLHIIKDAFVK
jgi:hypothetical protein